MGALNKTDEKMVGLTYSDAEPPLRDLAFVCARAILGPVTHNSVMNFPRTGPSLAKQPSSL